MESKQHDRARPCKKCGAIVVWFKTKRGGNIPIEASTVVTTDTVLNLSWHRKHVCAANADTPGE